jgi:Nucleoside-diphosphate-sugar epimerases
MKVLITGSTGFVGRHLLVMLEELDYEVIHLVRTRCGFNREFIWDFYGPLPEELPFCDVIIHLAAHVDFSLNLDIKQYNVNVVSTMRLADYAKSRNAYFILASMTGIHGCGHALIERFTPVNPDNNYSMSKYLAEEVVKIFVDNYSMLRICGIYGLDGPGHLGLNRAISSAFHEKEPPVLKGPGLAKRNYIYVRDVARWISCLIERHKAFLNENDNIEETIYMSSSEVLTIKEYLVAILDVLLPGKELITKVGDESADAVVSSSPVPFVMTTFRQHMESLLS